MKKFFLAAVIAACPIWVKAVDVNVNLGEVRVQAPGVTITFGSRNDRGYYWDGYEWRDPGYWKQHSRSAIVQEVNRRPIQNVIIIGVIA